MFSPVMATSLRIFHLVPAARFVLAGCVSSASASATGDASTPLRFVCGSCGTPLILPDAKSAASGPCPKCMAWIDSSQFVPPDTNAPVQAATRRRRKENVIGGRGRVRADGYLDHEYNDRRELFRTLRLLAVSLAVLAVILFITLYLKQWMATN